MEVVRSIRGGTRSIPTGETLKAALTLTDAGGIKGMKVQPPFEGWTKFQEIKGAGKTDIVPEVVFKLESSAPLSLRIVRKGFLKPLDTAGLVNEFGQYARQDWPGKVYNEAPDIPLC